MSFPVFTWPNWRKAARGTRFQHNLSGKTGTLIRPARGRHNGAIVVWDEYPFPVRSVDGADGHVYFVGIASDATPLEES